MSYPDHMQEESDLNAAEYLVKCELGQYPFTTPEEYLAYAVSMGADRERVQALAEEIRRGERPLDRLHGKMHPNPKKE